MQAKLGTSSPSFEKFDSFTVKVRDGGTLANPTHHLRGTINLNGDFHDDQVNESATSINLVQDPGGIDRWDVSVKKKDGSYHYGHTVGTLSEVIDMLKTSGKYENLVITGISAGTGMNYSTGLTEGYTILEGFTIGYDGREIIIPFTEGYMQK